MKPLVVKEHQRINKKTFEEYLEKISKETHVNVQEKHKNSFNEFLEFIKDFASLPNQEDAYTFMSVRKNRELGDYISFKNYVGLIQLKSGFQIEILPKIDFPNTKLNEEKRIEKSKEIFINMLKTLKDFKNKSFNKAYLNVLKGKLSIRDQIRKNHINKDKFYVKYDEYQFNKPMNRIIKATLLKLKSVSTNTENIRLIFRLLMHFELVEPSINYDDDFNKIIFNRTNKDYEWIINWSKVFLKNNSFTNFSGEFKSRALLFSMDRLFESYITKHIKNVFSSDFDVSTQDRGYYLFEKPENFALRPDIVLRKDGKPVVIMDAKWKELINSERKNFGIAQTDMYQMYAYSKKYATNGFNPEVWVLYPLNNDMVNYEKEISYLEFESKKNGVKVNIFLVNLDPDKIDDSIKQLLEKIKIKLKYVNELYRLVKKHNEI